MRISIIESDLSPRTGSRRFVYEVTHRLLAAGHQVKVFTNKLDSKTCFKQLLTLPIEVVTPRENYTCVPRKNIINKAIQYYLGQARLALETGKRAASFSPDVVLLHYTGERWLQPYFYHVRNSIGAVILNVLPPPAVADEPPTYQLYYYTMPRMSCWRYLMGQVPYNLPPISNWEKISLKKLKLIIAHSRYVAEKIGSHKIGNSKQIQVVPLGVDHSRFYPTWEEEPFLLSLGRIHPSKNLELAIYALRNVKSPEHLVIAGDVDQRFSWYKDKLERIANEIGVSNRVKIWTSPSQEDVVHLMQKCSIFLFPSLVDTFGMVVLEAMACGKPVVACKAGGVTELLENCGFALDPDPNIFAKTIEKLLLNAEMRRKSGKKSFEKAQLFTWDGVYSSLISTFQNQLSRGS